eukprot:TRINITY_DN6221_c0_g1_i1.p1 TRINITY_DN6221_c0_g1~~TRINITY_DN6221_c0_g1_i1.p1  ORF type:complete len:299 (-),score=162.15 TRINITY_DN6221_c0_g1_i1:62-958(-)
MSNPVLFKDLGKRVNDLLTKEYPTSEKKVEWKGTSVNNVTVDTNFVQKANGSVVGTITPSYKYKPYGLNLLAEVNTGRDVKLEATVENQLADGLKLIATAESKGNDSYATFSTEYKHPSATFTSYVDFGKNAGTTVKATSVFGAQGFFLGVSGEYFLENPEASKKDDKKNALKNFQTTVAYATKEFDASVFGRLIADKDKNELGATYFHNVNSDLSIGTEVVFDTANANVKPKLTLGSQYKLNDDTVVKGKFDTEGVLGFSYAQKFSKNSKLTIGANVNTNKLNEKDSTTFGFTLTLS